MPLSEQEVVQIIRDKQGDRSLRRYAEDLGISVQYLSEIYRGRRSPGQSALTPLGLVKTRKMVHIYEYARKPRLRKVS